MAEATEPDGAAKPAGPSYEITLTFPTEPTEQGGTEDRVVKLNSLVEAQAFLLGVGMVFGYVDGRIRVTTKWPKNRQRVCLNADLSELMGGGLIFGG